MNCLNEECNAVIPAHSRYCVVCGNDAGYPNVRAASQVSEIDALQDRVESARKYAMSVGAEHVLNSFCDAVRNSKAVITLPLGRLNKLVSSDNSLYESFYQSVDADSRLPEDNEWDRLREPVDALVFPYYYKQIRFGALTLDGKGVRKFGDLSIVLKDTSIRSRTTLFEKDTIEFVKSNIQEGISIPPGHRAVWETRDRLATAKIATNILASTKEESFPALLLDGDDYIEVHIFGPIHRRAIEKLTGKRPKSKADRLIYRSIERKVKEIDVEVEVN